MRIAHNARTLTTINVLNSMDSVVVYQTYSSQGSITARSE